MVKVISIMDSENIVIDLGKVDGLKVDDTVTVIDEFKSINGYENKEIIIPIKKQDFIVFRYL